MPVRRETRMCRSLLQVPLFPYRGIAISRDRQGQRGSSAMWIHLVSVREVQERLPTAQHIPEWKTSSEPRDARRNNSSLCLPRGVGRAGLLRPELASFCLAGNWPGRFQSSQAREFVSYRGHLCTQPVENRERRFLCARREIARGPNAGRATLFTFARRNQLARFLHK